MTITVGIYGIILLNILLSIYFIINLSTILFDDFPLKSEKVDVSFTRIYESLFEESDDHDF